MQSTEQPILHPDEETPAPTLEAVLLDGLTAMGDETPAMSVLADVSQELDAIIEIIGLEAKGDPLDRPAMLVLLAGLERRLRAGLTLLRRERDAAPAGAEP